MKVPDKHFILEKANKYLQGDIGPGMYVESVDIGGWSYVEYESDDVPHSFNDFKNIPASDFKPIGFTDRWGGYDKTAWFKTEFTIDSNFIKPGFKYCLRLLMGQSGGWGQNVEALIYVNGQSVQGMDWCHLEAFLDDELLKSGKLSIAAKTWSGLAESPTFRVFGETKLRKVHPASEEFYYLVKALVETIPLLPENDLKRFKLAKVLQETFKYINFLKPKSEAYYASIETALAFIKDELAKLRMPELKPTVHAVGHSHIDMAWLWRLSATREKASRTFSTVLNLMREYPEYLFMHSSPQLYKFLEEDYPELFARVKEKIESGEWEATGGMWVESDTNVPSGESLVRQFLFGKRYLKDIFGQDSKVLWLPDVFGYSAALPQIAKKSGIDYFMTTKISWNQYNHFPHDTFNWRGIDGTELLTHFITTPSDAWFYTYNGQLTPHEIPGIWVNYKQKDVNSELLLAYGHGDGGGGPTREMLETRRALEDIPGIPYVKMNKVEPYFELLAKELEGKALETWDGELYFEYHRGTYTSQGYNKKSNRVMESLLHDAELLSIMLKDGYPQEALNEIWERVLLLQFHDIIPGSSIKEVYTDSRVDYEKMLKDTAALVDSAVGALNGKLHVTEDSAVVYNTLSWERNEEVFVPFSNMVSKDTLFTDANGNVMQSQVVDGGLLVIFTALPSLGYKTFAISKGAAAAVSKIDASAFKSELKLDTPFYKVVFNKNGEMVSLYDKEAKRNIGKGDLGVLQAFEDKPLNFDAWDIDVFYKEKPYNCFEYTGLEIVEEGAIKTVIRRTVKFSESNITQDIIFYNHTRRIDFKTVADWHESQVLLKVAFPLNIRSVNVTYDIQFGHVERPNHSNNERDFAQFEVCGHKWADLSENGYGVALMNDCKYGHDCKDSVLRLTLVKSPIEPDRKADQGIHEFTYALYPHVGAFAESDVQAVAAAFNSPVRVYEKAKDANGDKFVSSSWMSVEAATNHVIIDTLKKAEDDGSVILRVFENGNREENDVVIRLSDSFDVKEVVETNLMEEVLAEQDVVLEGKTIRFSIKPFEVKTFKLK